MNSCVFGMVASAAVLASGAAAAQGAQVGPGLGAATAGRSNFDRDRNVSVLERPHPEYDALGLPVGAFRLFPKLTVGIVSDDNIFAQPTGEVSDTILQTDAEVTARSQWSRHRLTAFVRGRIADYQDFSTENFTDYQIGATGQLDILRDAAIGAGANFGKLTEPRTANNSPLTVTEPVRYSQSALNLQYVQSFNRLRLLGRVDQVTLDYENGENALGGLVFQDDRDRSVTGATGRVEYAVSPDTAVFFETVANVRRYDLSPPTVATDRDSDGFEMSVGANVDLSRLVRGEFQVGYLSQDYDGAGLEDFDTVTARARVEWFPTDLLTVSAVLGRTVEDATGVGISGYLSTTAGLQADYEVRRNVIVTAAVDFETADYGNFDRQDDRWSSRLEATYKVNRTLSVQGRFEHLERSSSGLAAAGDFAINRFQVAFILQR